MKDWGLLPDDVRGSLKKNEWNHPRHLPQRLLGERAFPLAVNLRPPSGKKALDDLAAFHAFVQAWQHWPNPHQVNWKHTKYAQLGEVSVPTHLTLSSIQELITMIGDEAVTRSESWQQRLIPILEVSQALYPVLVRNLKKLESLSRGEAHMIARLLPQLKQGMGNSGYLRALPIAGIDTKFLETHLTFISALLDELHGGAVSAAGGVIPWLDCIAVPSDWLLVRPLCPKTLQALGGLPIFRAPTEVLLSSTLPGGRILVVENNQSGYSLPVLSDTVAVIGGGSNLAWMQAPWLKEKAIGYWGDLDTWGFAFLSEARRRQSHVTSLLMDKATLIHHRHHLVGEPNPYTAIPEYLTEAESQVFQDLRDSRYGNGRLEQEKLHADYIVEALKNWV
ncbi:MAG: DUF3322 domain-containing protein [Exilibacterium sp.]